MSLFKKYNGFFSWYAAVCLILVSLPARFQETEKPSLAVTESLVTPKSFNRTTSRTPDKPPGAQIRRFVAMTVDSIGVLCNTLLIVTLLVDPLNSLRRGAWITILNLAIADLIAATSNFMYVGQTFELDIRNPVVFTTFSFFWMFGVGASFMLLTSLTVQTYLIVKHPIKSRLILTDKKIGLSCLAIWILAIPLGLSNIVYVFDFTTAQAMKIYITQIAVLELLVFCQVVLKVLIIREIMKSRRDTEVMAKHQNSKHKEIAKTIVILNVILVVTAFPYFFAKQMEYLWRLDVLDDDPWKLIGNYYEPIATLNFAANPILYSLRLSDYRRSLLGLLCRRRSERSLSRSSGTMGNTANTVSMRSASSIRPPLADRNMTKV